MAPLPPPSSHFLSFLLFLFLFQPFADLVKASSERANLFLGFHTLDRGAGTPELSKLFKKLNFQHNDDGELLSSTIKYSIAVARGEHPAPRFGINTTALDIPQRFNISFLHRRTENGDKIGTLKVLLNYLMRLNTSAVIGTQHSCDTEVKVASALNKPLITFKCDKEIKENIEPRTFARIQPPRWKIAKFIISILKHFDWHKYTLVVSKDMKWQLTARALRRYSKLHKKQVLRMHVFGKRVTEELPQIIEDSYTTTRIYVILGNDLDISMFLGFLHKKELLQTGDYAVITHAGHNFLKKEMNLFVGSLFGSKGSDQSMNLPPEVFRQTLIVQPREAVQEAEKEFVSNVLRFFKGSKQEIGEFNDRNPAYLYDAVMVYLKAIAHVALEENRKGLSVEEAISNGKLVFEAIRGTTFETILGYDVAIDHNGEAEGNYSIYTLKTGPEDKSSFKSVAWFSSALEDELPVLHESNEHRIPWIKGRAPLSEPKCGFDGSKCGRLLASNSSTFENSRLMAKFWRTMLEMKIDEHRARMRLLHEMESKVKEMGASTSSQSFAHLFRSCKKVCINR